jgi:hypothetical protein
LNGSSCIVLLASSPEAKQRAQILTHIERGIDTPCTSAPAASSPVFLGTLQLGMLIVMQVTAAIYFAASMPLLLGCTSTRRECNQTLEWTCRSPIMRATFHLLSRLLPWSLWLLHSPLLRLTGHNQGEVTPVSFKCATNLRVSNSTTPQKADDRSRWDVEWSWG